MYLWIGCLVFVCCFTLSDDLSGFIEGVDKALAAW